MNTVQPSLILLDTSQVADLLGVKEGTVCNWRWNGSGPPFVNLGGRRVRYRLCDVEGWIAGQVRSSTSQEPGDGRAA